MKLRPQKQFKARQMPFPFVFEATWQRSAIAKSHRDRQKSVAASFSTLGVRVPSPETFLDVPLPFSS
jgi:hypothetical protein